MCAELPLQQGWSRVGARAQQVCQATSVGVVQGGRTGSAAVPCYISRDGPGWAQRGKLQLACRVQGGCILSFGPYSVVVLILGMSIFLKWALCRAYKETNDTNCF